MGHFHPTTKDRGLSRSLFCKVCGKEFCNCSDGHPDVHISLGYCDKDCFIKDSWTQEFLNRTKKLYDSLTFDQKLELWTLRDNGILDEGVYESLIDDIIIDPRED